ncbi:MAG TPA: S41 family peptidase [Gammaproteobacteria bacterium]|nr:S41 family peptidase [Gammaproteobacteria bacterium]
MASRFRRPRRTKGIAVASLLWLVVGIGAGIILDRQVLSGMVASSALPFTAVPDFRLMGQAWNLIEKHYVDRSAVKPRQMTYGAISGMVDSLGDTGHSVFLTPKMVRQAKEQIQGHFPGIGAEVRMENKHVVVVAPLDGSPAQRAGLRPGDVIFKVDGKDVAGQSLDQVVGRIRGPAGSQVSLSLGRPHSDHTRTVSLTRAVIHVHSVSWRMIPGTRVVDVRIATFSQGTGKELAHALENLRQAGARGLILDLRNDPGGLLNQAVSVASRFLKGGNVLLEKNAKGKIHPVPVDSGTGSAKLPMVVLINQGTASAAEIVSGALKDAGKARLVGQTTFGTGTVLHEFRLSDGSALMLAIEEWLTPDGHTIWHKGITPDVKVALGDDVFPLTPATLKGMSAKAVRTSKDTQLLKALSMLPGDQPGSQMARRSQAGG